MRTTLQTFLLALFALALTLPAGADLPVVRVATLQDGPVSAREVRLLYQRELEALTQGEFDVRFESRHQRSGDWTAPAVQAELEALLSDPEVDVVLTLGPLGSQLTCCILDLPKPVIATVVVDTVLQGLPNVAGTSGVPNLNYLARPLTFERDLDALLDLVRVQKVAVMANAQLIASMPGLEERVRDTFEQRGLEYLYVGVGASPEEALASIPAEAEAVYLTPLFQLDGEEWGRLIAGINERGLPSFSYLGEEEVEAGVLAGMATSSFFPRLARRVALNVQRILLGETAGSLPVAFPARRQLTINMDTARQVGVSPRWDLLVEAVLLNPEDSQLERRISLTSVVLEAIEANLDLLASARALEAGAQDVRAATARLLPQVDAGVTGLVVDRERAAASFGSQPERSVTGELSLTQLLYSEQALAGRRIQGLVQLSREAEFEQIRLDVAQVAATRYLNVLRAKALERIERDNLRLTRSNLDLAEVRREIGTAGEAEVVRWQSQMAAGRRNVVDARVGVEQAQVALNQLLHRPIEEPFLTTEVDLDDPVLIMSEDRLDDYTNNPRRFELVRDFMVIDGLERSPELAQLDRLIEAKERELQSARRAFTHPTAALSGSVSDRVAESGAGTEPIDLGLPIELGSSSTSAWQIALNFSLPLYRGGERAAAVAKAEAELGELRLRRTAVAEQLETRIRAALFGANGSFQGIELSQVSAAAARRNLELVADAYGRGALSILDLLDAQNAALVAEQLAANAAYDFLIDLMEVERATNRFDFLIEPAERREWLESLGRYLQESGIRLEEE